MDPLTRDDFRRAMDLWAATYSDASVSPKTTAMQADVVKLQEFKDDLQYLAKRGLGEEVKKSGGFFGNRQGCAGMRARM